MKLHLNWKYVNGDFDTKTAKLQMLPGEKGYDDSAEICLNDGLLLSIGKISLGCGQVDDAGLLAEEIVRRFNEFPEELKK